MSQRVCALVGAGPGLGLAIAQKFGREGYQIALLARRPEALEEYPNTLSNAGIEARGFSVDAADPASIATAFAQIHQTLGAPTVLVYNAALLKQDSILSLTNDELIQDFKVNVTGAITLRELRSNRRDAASHS